MSTQIIAETCPAPECNLSPKDVEQFVEELRAYHEQFMPAFRRPEQARWSDWLHHMVLFISSTSSTSLPPAGRSLTPRATARAR